MSERLTPELLEKFKGVSVDDVKTRIRNKNLIALAKAVGAKNPKYFGDSPVVHPAYIGTVIVKALFSLADAKVQDENGNDVLLITNPGKILHGGQGYKYYDAEVKDKDVLITSGSLENVYIKNEMLFMEAKMVTKKEDGTLVQETFISAIARKGGF